MCSYKETATTVDVCVCSPRSENLCRLISLILLIKKNIYKPDCVNYDIAPHVTPVFVSVFCICAFKVLCVSIYGARNVYTNVPMCFDSKNVRFQSVPLIY